MHLEMYYYIKLSLVLFKSFTSAGHTNKEFFCRFSAPFLLYFQKTIRLDLPEKITKDFKT